MWTETEWRATGNSSFICLRIRNDFEKWLQVKHMPRHWHRDTDTSCMKITIHLIMLSKKKMEQTAIHFQNVTYTATPPKIPFCIESMCPPRMWAWPHHRYGVYFAERNTDTHKHGGWSDPESVPWSDAETSLPLIVLSGDLTSSVSRGYCFV